MRRIAWCLAAICCVAMVRVGSANEDEVDPKSSLQWHLLALPVGSEVASLEVRRTDMKLLYRQDAIYEMDLDGDGQPEVVVFYLKYMTPRSENRADMHLGIIKADPANIADTAKLVADCALPGTYFWSDKSKKKSAMAIRERAGNGIVIYCVPAYGASVGPNLVKISVTRKDKQLACEAYTLATAVGDVSIEGDDLEYTLRGQSGSHHINIADDREPASPTSAPAPGAQR